MKKLMSALIAAALAAGSAVPVLAADTFSDVNAKSYSWAQEYVEDMAEKGLIKGYDDGTFRPGNAVSRMEAFALFARLMGSNNEVNSDILDAAKEKYASVLEKYDLTYAEGDIAYMLSRGVITESELDTYFGGKRKSEPMPRYEAAILITKAMAAEETVKSSTATELNYTDAAEIPKTAKLYVGYVSEKGIMTGMDNGVFSPETAVLRGQMAVMLSKTSDSVEYSFERATLVSADEKSDTIEIQYSDASKRKINYSSDTKFFKNCEPAAASDLSAGQTLILTAIGDAEEEKPMFVDILATDIDSELSGIFQGYASQAGTLTVSLMDPATGTTKTYQCNPNVAVTADSILSDINKLKAGDYVTVGLSDTTVQSINAIQRSATVVGVIEATHPSGTITISSDDEDFDGVTLSMTNTVKILKNGETSDFSSLYKGDTVTVTLEYGLVSKIISTSAKKTVSGILKSYTVSSTPTIVIKNDGEEYTYNLTADVQVTINGEAAKLADFEIGSSVTLTLESDAVKKIESSKNGGTLTASKLTGVVTGVNAAAKVIVIKYMEAGAETQAYITCTDTTKYQVIPTLGDYALKSIKIGDTIDAYGSYSNGIFVSSGINVMPAGK